ncbi:decarboxylating NADP(+)-dependent phosphogluconate dehydrogenase [Spirochaeta isovalerica]|uniref:6-phosphogluconate dehydrogenase, decarboxylating n=1 Tax=Spirochaeta isovalerica TaxID=150 RepID=A0A841RA58_9SPIO|nr:decarboxylating NADP(+)-dependent phosphogluconate dehydrogenase [Spirochaeta isovalerica]MBB6479332.1 6-phosphogluconate dehydrogenase [Spirochaeta isovalerica]
MKKADIGLIGLAVMGQNLVLNMADNGYTVAVYNRTTQKMTDFIEGPAKGYDNIVGAETIEDFIAQLERPRRVMLMVKAGEVVDKFIETVLPHLEEGDIIIDGGNSHFPDSNRRTKELAEKGIHFIGTGVSGGEEGARRGPSIMPGGNEKAWPYVKPVFQAISAKTENGEACCDWVGNDGAGHYVKMVHNGIEYGDMQLITEAYQLLHEAIGMNYEEMHKVFADYNKGPLDSYLIEITRDILAFRDDAGEPLVEKILDTAGQKGTGKWTGISALDLGMPVTLIGESVFARCLSALKDERVAASKKIKGPDVTFSGDKDEFVKDLEQALLFAKIISYAQGFMLMKEAAKEYSWKLNYGAIALMWRGGCIIRSVFLGKIKEAFDKNPELSNLIMDDYFGDILQKAQNSLRKVVTAAVTLGIPVPTLSTALAFFDGYRSERLPANLLQAQRDYFGAHTYERTDKPRGEFFHTNWTGTGGNVSSTTYEV